MIVPVLVLPVGEETSVKVSLVITDCMYFSRVDFPFLKCQESMMRAFDLVVSTSPANLVSKLYM